MAREHGGLSYTEETVIDGFPATQGARASNVPSSMLDGEPLGYLLEGYAHLHRVRGQKGEPDRDIDGITRARVEFETLDTSERALREAAAAASFALQSLRMAAQRQNSPEKTIELT